MQFSFLVFLILYACMIGILGLHWKRHPIFQPKSEKMLARLSVVIAFHNESEALPKCIRSIEGQGLKRENFEVILADDHSTDGSGEYALNYCNLNKGFKYCAPSDERKGKKAALLRGVQMAANELIVLTDADCFAGKQWLETVAAFYTNSKADMIVGLVDMEIEGGAMASFQKLEFLSLTGIAAGAVALGRPLYCSSANLAFKKALFEEYPDPFRIAVSSGDDTFFLHQVKKDRGKRVKLLKSRLAVVTTSGKNSLAGFLKQRLRWASKSIHYRDADTILAALVTLLLNLSLIVSLVMLIGAYCSWLFPVLFFIKLSVDFFLMKDVLSFFGKETNLIRFSLFVIIYMVYLTIAAIAGFVVKVKWH